MNSRSKITLAIQVVTGAAGAAIVWWKVGFWIALAVFLLVWSEHCWAALTLKLKNDP